MKDEVFIDKTLVKQSEKSWIKQKERSLPRVYVCDIDAVALPDVNAILENYALRLWRL